ncbi:MAG: hypothetical protein JXM71_09290 [Spirochaetales bacterium]|nr:hypothetical protein [Spirochaetales bacterium]
MYRLGRYAALAAVLAVSILAASADDFASASAQPFKGVIGPLPGSYATTQVLLPASLAMGLDIEYRFTGHDAWFLFDRPVYLSAFAGEERSYAIEFRHPGESPDLAESATLRYTIDSRPPEAPRFSVPSGDAGSLLRLSAEADGSVFICIDGGPFSLFSPGSFEEFKAPANATRIIHAIAYAVDNVGNESGTSASTWRLAPEGFVPSFPFSVAAPETKIVKIEADDTCSATLSDLVGSARVTVDVPAGTVPYIAINPSAPFGSVASYAALSGDQSPSSCVVPFPWGYEREILVYYGYKREETLHVASEPLRLSPRFPVEDAVTAPTLPVEPRIHVGPQAAVVDWPTSPWTTFVAIGGEEFRRYEDPITVSLGDTVKTIRYYSLGQSGSRSTVASFQLPPGTPMGVPVVGGVVDKAVYGSSVTMSITPDETALTSDVRYSLAEGDESPPPVTLDSPVVGERGVLFEGKDGQSVLYRVRLVAIGDGIAKSEMLLSFTVDREPPAIPALAYGAHYSASDTVVSFKPQEGTIHVSISERGDGAFVVYDKPITISGSDDGRRRYVIRAWAEDAFGNRSAEMEPRHVLIDRSSLYADPRGRPGASGSPDDPIGFLDDAVDLAMKTGKTFIYARGTTTLRRPVAIRGKLTIAGGFDEDWNESTSSRAKLTIRLDRYPGSYAFNVESGKFSLQSIDASMTGQGNSGIIKASGGTVSVENSTLKGAGGVEMVVIRGAGASIHAQSSYLELASTITGRGVDATDGTLSMDDVSISCGSSVRVFDAIRVSDGKAELSGLRIEGTPDQTLSALSLTRSKGSVERAVIVVSGGTSSSRLFAVNASELTVSSSYVDSKWKGTFEAFSATGGSTMLVSNVSAIMNSPRVIFMSSTASRFTILNSIAVSSGRLSAFVRSDSIPEAGSISANCLWGFSRIAEGALALTSIRELDRFMLEGYPNVIEDPERTFRSTVKGLKRLSGSSACVDAGVPADWAGDQDLLGGPRVSGAGEKKPDIGAEEL